MNDLPQIEKLLEELSEYHQGMFMNNIGGLQRKLYFVRMALEDEVDVHQAKKDVKEKADVFKNHFSKECYQNPPEYLKEAVQETLSSYQKLEDVLDNFLEKSEINEDVIGKVEVSVTENGNNITSTYNHKFLTIIADVLRIYDKKGGSVNDLCSRIDEKIDKSEGYKDPLQKMIVFAKTYGEEYFDEEKEHIERVRKSYPEFLK